MSRVLLPLLCLLLACGDKDPSSDDDDDGVGLDSGFDGGFDGGADGGSDGGSDDDADNDGYSSDEDCNDDDANVHPFADEYCDGIDNDCDGTIDEATALDAIRWYPDEDSDGYGAGDADQYGCEAPEGTAATGDDCDDSDPDVHPGADETCNDVDDDCDDEVDEDPVDGDPWHPDVDMDGYGDPGSVMYSCDAPDGWTADDQDCDDSDDSVHPAGTERCDDAGADEDCDGLVNDEDPSVDTTDGVTGYADADEDGFGDPAAATRTCELPVGAVTNDDDCDDADDSVHPDATEVCDATRVDEDCDDLSNDDDPSVDSSTAFSWYRDDDGDGYGDSSSSTSACDDPSVGSTVWVSDDRDCDDGDDAVNPGETEVCDDGDIDEDCSGLSDDDDPAVSTATQERWYADGDRDGFGDPDSSGLYCDDPSAGGSLWVQDDQDCDDGNGAINPDAQEVCDVADTDEDCDGLHDGDDPSVDVDSYATWYADLDGDGYGGSDVADEACEDPSDADISYTSTADDCDDDDPDINPDAAEICDGADNDCDPDTVATGVTWVPDGGASTDVSSSFSSGTSSSPVAYAVDSAGELNFCGGTFYTRLLVSADVTITGSEGAVIDGAGSGVPISVSGSDTDLTVIGLTIQDGYSTSSIIGANITCYYAATVTLQGVSSTGGNARYGGGVHGYHCGDLSVTDSVLTDNYAGYAGAAIYWIEGDVTVDNSFIDDNTVASGGGGALFGGGGGDVVITDSLISNNTVSSYGGGVYWSGGNVSMTDTIFEDNSAYSGAGVYLGFYSSSTTSDLYCTETEGATSGFFRNTSSYSTGAAVLTGSSILLRSSGCDFGTGSDDNSPYDFASSSYETSLGNDVTTVCSSYGCS